MLEERIVGGDHFVERHALRETPQPERARVRDEMDLVPPPREVETELGGDRTGAAVGRVAGDADSHARSAFSFQPDSRQVRTALPALEDLVGQAFRTLRRVE